MAMDQKKYIDIVSGVGGASSVSRRDLMGRVMTTNPLAAIGTTYELSLDGVGTLFGTSSEEYAYALKYFSFISKSITQASKLSFTRWAKTDAVGFLEGGDIDELSLIEDGEFQITINGVVNEITGIDLSVLSTAADYITTQLQLLDAADKCTCTLTQATAPYRFKITMDVAGGTIGYAEPISGGSGTDVSTYMQFTEETATALSQGLALETPVAAITRVSELSDNFGSFCFLDALTNDEIDTVAAWVTAGNYKFLYSVPVLAANAATLTALLGGATGTIVTLADALTDYAEFMPMALLATTDYDRVNSVKNFMFQKFDSETPTVTTDALSDSYDALYVNYLGTTQQAGKLIAFYQRGLMMDGSDVAPYCNEIWLKDAFATQYLNLLLALEKIPANTTGINIARTNMQSIIDEAIFNGTILPGKTLTTTQKSYIDQVTGTADSWRDIEKIGYWLGIVIEEDEGEYTLDYTLVYSKGDSIRKVTGTDILI